MNKIIIFKSIYCGILCIFLILSAEVSSADTSSIKVEGWVNIQDKKFSPYQSSLRNKMKNAMGIRLKSKTKGFSSNLTFSINNENKILFDETNLNYRLKNITFGLGKISRQWSFSPNTSLILSKNARPTTSAYIIINDFVSKKNKSQSMLDAWSIEFFNSLLKGSNNPNKSMLLGTRILFSPINNLDFELIKVSQWGGEGNNNGPSAFKAAFLGDSNDGKNSNINQIAGFGISYTIPKDIYPIRVYGQFIGEDEAGNLPSCYIYLGGTEIPYYNGKYKQNFGLEITDTRIKFTSHGNCGPNTAYNNNTYKYTNYGQVMGAPIDTEGRSIKLWSDIKLSRKFKIMYSLENVLINDTNWLNHRISSSRQNNWNGEASFSWATNKFKFIGGITKQGLDLDKLNIKSGLGIYIHSAVKF